MKKITEAEVKSFFEKNAGNIYYKKIGGYYGFFKLCGGKWNVGAGRSDFEEYNDGEFKGYKATKGKQAFVVAVKV